MPHATASGDGPAIPPLSFSIISPTLNHAEFLGGAIRSVLRQDWPALEYRIRDGGSTDQTRAVVAGFAERVQFTIEPDAGQADAINKGVAQTRGDIVAWLNADDELCPGALAAVAQAFAAQPAADVIYGKAIFIDAEGRFIAPCAHIRRFDRNRLLREMDFIVQPACFIRRSAFDAVGGVDRSLNWGFDYDLWLKLSWRHRFLHVPVVLARCRFLPDSKTATGAEARLEEIARIARRHGNDRLPASFRLEAIRLLAREALNHAHAGRFIPALMQLGKIWSHLCDTRVLSQLCEAQTWDIIRTGSRLRRANRRSGGRQIAV